MQKSAFLLPDKGTYRKIEADNNHEYADINKAYDTFISNAENNFNTLKSKTDNWENVNMNAQLPAIQRWENWLYQRLW